MTCWRRSVFTNHLAAIPEALFAGLTLCSRFSAWTNALTTLPDTLGAMTNLQELWLYGNRLQSLPPEISRLSLLKRL